MAAEAEVFRTPGGELSWAFCGRLMLFVQHAPADDEAWRYYLQRVTAAVAPGHFTTVLVCSRSDFPTAAQRDLFKQLASKHLSAVTHCALLSDSVAVRSAMAAFSWLRTIPFRIKCFSTSQAEQGLAWLATASPAPTGALELFKTTSAALPPTSA